MIRPASGARTVLECSPLPAKGAEPKRPIGVKHLDPERRTAQRLPPEIGPPPTWPWAKSSAAWRRSDCVQGGQRPAEQRWMPEAAASGATKSVLRKGRPGLPVKRTCPWRTLRPRSPVPSARAARPLRTSDRVSRTAAAGCPSQSCLAAWEGRTGTKQPAQRWTQRGRPAGSIPTAYHRLEVSPAPRRSRRKVLVVPTTAALLVLRS